MTCYSASFPDSVADNPPIDSAVADSQADSPPLADISRAAIASEITQLGESVFVDRCYQLQKDLLAWQSAAAELGVQDLDHFTEVCSFTNVVMDVLAEKRGPEGLEEVSERWRQLDSVIKLTQKLETSEYAKTQLETEVSELRGRVEALTGSHSHGNLLSVYVQGSGSCEKTTEHAAATEETMSVHGECNKTIERLQQREALLVREAEGSRRLLESVLREKYAEIAKLKNRLRICLASKETKKMRRVKRKSEVV